MENLALNSVLYAGSAVEQEIVVADASRRYLGLYVQSGEVSVSFGNGDHTDNVVKISQGNWHNIPSSGRVVYTGAGTKLLVTQERESATSMTVLNTVATYLGKTVTLKLN